MEECPAALPPKTHSHADLQCSHAFLSALKASPAPHKSAAPCPWQDHDKNLANDPTQRLSEKERRAAAKRERRRLQQQAAAERAAAVAQAGAQVGLLEGRVMTRGMRAQMRINKASLAGWVPGAEG